MLGSGKTAWPQSCKKELSIETKYLTMNVPLQHERRVPMLNNDYTAKLLNLEEVIITNIEG